MIDPHTLIMSSEAMPIGNGFTVTFTMEAGRMEAAFAPYFPKGRKARCFLAPYRLARDEFLRRVALRTGLTVAVVEA